MKQKYCNLYIPGPLTGRSLAHSGRVSIPGLLTLREKCFGSGAAHTQGDGRHGGSISARAPSSVTETNAPPNTATSGTLSPFSMADLELP